MLKIKSQVKKKSSSKGAFIKGMTKQLPSGILANPVFKKGLKEVMKGYSGIYALYRKDKIYYVGLASNLHGRINQHLKDHHKNKWDGFRIFRIKRIKYLKEIETLITHLIQLPGNRVKGKVPKDADINKVLRDILTQHSKEIREIGKALKK